jgi:hypothetical protein
MSSISADELTNSVSKLVELNKQITEARADIKVLSDAEKTLKSHIKKLMIDNGLDVINLKVSIKDGLNVFFDGNETQAETALKVILDSLPTKESSTISLSGLKDKKQ